MKHITILLIALSIYKFNFSQTVLITDDDWTSSSTNGACGCATNFNNGSIQNFFDSGNSGSSYSANENEVITFCPDATGSKVVAVFATNAGYVFDVDASDSIFIYDGPSTSSLILDTLNNVLSPNGANIAATWSNTSGCLTIQFKSDASIETAGWAGNISCSNLSQPFFNGMVAYINGQANGAGDVIDDMNPNDTGYVDVCLGDSVWLVAKPYFPYEPGGDSAALSGGGYMQSTNNTITWDISDGSSYTGDSILFIPTARNGYYVQLKVEDSYGIFNYSSAKIRVSTVPSFVTCMALDDTICLGSSTQLFGGVTVTDTVGVDPVQTTFPIGGVFGAQTYLPDGSGQNYTTDITISGFTPGGTIQSSTDIQKICVDIEHSYLGDLEMMLTCPNGQNINVFNSYTGNGLYAGGFGGGGDFLGGAFDNNTGNIGVCEEYCFSMQPGALPSWNNGYNLMVASGPSLGTMVVPGTYQPEQAFTPTLQNCPINGTWTITVRDNIGIDDGYICQWGIYFEDTLNPNSEYYAPMISSEFWHPDPTIIVDDDTVVIVQPNALGNHSYIFEVEDSYGCSYYTTITINVSEGAYLMGDTLVCGDSFTYPVDSITSTGGGIWSYSGIGNLIFDPSDTTTVNLTLDVDAFGPYTLSFFDNKCNDTLSHQILFLDGPSVSVYPFDTICSGENYNVNITSTSVQGVSYSWIDNSGNILANGDTVQINTSNYSDGTYIFTVQAINYCDTASGQVELVIESCVIPNIITPDGDNINDYFYTSFAKNYPDVHLSIFNRWGKLVYRTDAYQNEWSGQNNKGNKLSDGVYYYVIEYNGKQEKGHVTIMGSGE